MRSENQRRRRSARRDVRRRPLEDGDNADYTLEAGDAEAVAASRASRQTSGHRPASHVENCSALCRFWRWAFQSTSAYVLLSLGSAASAAPSTRRRWRTLGGRVGRPTATSRRSLDPNYEGGSWRSTFREGHYGWKWEGPRVMMVGDVTRSMIGCCTRNYHGRWLTKGARLTQNGRRPGLMQSVAGVRYAEPQAPTLPRAHLGHLVPGAVQALPNAYAGKAALRSGTQTHVGDLFRHAIVLSRLVGRYCTATTKPYYVAPCLSRVFALGCGVAVWLAPHHGAVGAWSRAVLGTSSLN